MFVKSNYIFQIEVPIKMHIKIGNLLRPHLFICQFSFATARSDISEPVKDLVRWILTPEPRSRPDIGRVLLCSVLRIEVAANGFEPKITPA